MTIYGQTEVVKDLIRARETGAPLYFDASDVRLEGIDGDCPRVRFEHVGLRHELRADVVAGCDGFYGICRQAIPAEVLKV